MSEDWVIQCRGLCKSFDEMHMNVDVLENIEFNVTAGERVAIVGASGSGKSTLLHLLGGLDKPSSGQVIINDVNISKLSEANKSRFRNKHLGFVYQFHHLLPEFTALENVCMPLLIRGLCVDVARQQATDILSEVGLKARLRHKPGELSGGERQRAAIARAVVTKPSCILADEPTGNLDSKTAEHVYSMMLALNQSLKTSFVVVTHDESLAAKMDRVLRLDAGKLV
ncbi:MAG TPA: lipoprotein-releasing ABC transporter ATP-binding protein LolD [Gammaproteobacteria bacterium]|nr:lipoprotein-releasing ABC transporter ATP-binding protein LolD [Gammaproteobacteria bacterium]